MEETRLYRLLLDLTKGVKLKHYKSDHNHFHQLDYNAKEQVY